MPTFYAINSNLFARHTTSCSRSHDQAGATARSEPRTPEEADPAMTAPTRTQALTPEGANLWHALGIRLLAIAPVPPAHRRRRGRA